jgi:prophage tail gpP-like protein
MTDELILKVNGKQFTNFKEFSVNYGIELMPSFASISYSNKDVDILKIGCGNPCTIYFGDTLVLTGRITSFGTPQESPTNHDRTITIKSRTCDLVESHYPIWLNGAYGSQFQGPITLKDLAEKICDPYGINVNYTARDNYTQIPQVMISPGQTPYEILDPYCKYIGVLMMDSPDGSLLICDVTDDMTPEQGSSTFGLPVKKDVNPAVYTPMNNAVVTIDGIQTTMARGMPEEFTNNFSWDYRYTDYYVYNPVGVSTSDEANAQMDNIRVHVVDQELKDAGIIRYWYIQNNYYDSQLGSNFAARLANWTCNRNIGRSKQYTVTYSGFRDDRNELYMPNQMCCRVYDDMGNLLPMVIGHSTYTKSVDSGTKTQIQIMPRQAFLVEPMVLTNTPNTDPSDLRTKDTVIDAPIAGLPTQDISNIG